MVPIHRSKFVLRNRFVFTCCGTHSKNVGDNDHQSLKMSTPEVSYSEPYEE